MQKATAINVNAIKSAINSTGLTMSALSRKMGFCDSYWTVAVREKKVKAESLQKLADLAGVPVETLIDEETMRSLEMAKVNVEAVKAAIKKTGRGAAKLSREFGYCDGYWSNCTARGKTKMESLRKLADIAGVPVESLLLEPPKPEEPAAVEETTEQANPNLDLDEISKRLDAIEATLSEIQNDTKRLAAIELREERLVNTMSAMSGLMTNWDAILDAIRRKGAGIETYMARLLHVWEDGKPMSKDERTALYRKNLEVRK